MSEPAEISALEPAGIQAEHIHDLFDGFFGLSIAVFVLVIGALVIALVRPKQELGEEGKKERRRIVGVATGLTLVLLIVLLVTSVVTGRAIASLSPQDAVPIDIVGHRWWWAIEYPDAVPANIVRTAYEVHVPVGKTIELRLASHDVIHSLWVPNLGPKRDLIPGKPTTLLLRADRAGTYDGMCAEYCGMQHANMRIRFVAEPEDRFRAWLARQREPAKAPDDDVKRRGQHLFTTHRCYACHAITGTDAYATVGPDLTHVASRRRIAMGTLPNDQDHLARWVRDPHRAKPGVIMPDGDLEPRDLDALLAYLGSLE